MAHANSTCKYSCGIRAESTQRCYEQHPWAWGNAHEQEPLTPLQEILREYMVQMYKEYKISSSMRHTVSVCRPLEETEVTQICAQLWRFVRTKAKTNTSQRQQWASLGMQERLAR